MDSLIGPQGVLHRVKMGVKMDKLTQASVFYIVPMSNQTLFLLLIFYGNTESSLEIIHKI